MPMLTPRGLALVGTDTGVGKTTVARGLLRLGRRLGLRILPFKPVESGVTSAVESDADLLRRAAGSSPSPSLYCLPLPISPMTAARHAGVSLEIGVMRKRALELANQGDGILLETAGGLLSPWDKEISAANLLTDLALPTLVVAADVLGSQNHTLLTTEALTRREIPVSGVLLVGRSDDDARWENETAFADLFGADYLGRLPRLPSPTDDQLADAIERCRGRELLAALIARSRH